jgi:hypothetical protein
MALLGAMDITIAPEHYPIAHDLGDAVKHILAGGYLGKHCVAHPARLGLGEHNHVAPVL